MYNENNENNELNINEEVTPETETVTSDEKPVKKERKPLSKKVKYRINFSTVAVLFVAVFVAINLLCGALSERINLNIDLTSGGLLSISDETKTVLKNLSKDDIHTIVDSTPLNRIGKPKDVANLVKFLASEKANFITGQIITIDGGLTL